ncbi:MAG TPA: imidazole glycerol phosphate synthase subunit HisH [Methanomassiliicoccales archaeon]|nr:imidazole glycerol phosphate synthase subunit HisH [Methanomassiliicoccales archaeon]
MSVKIAIADYGVGNLHSIRKSLEICGSFPYLVEDMRELLDAECIVLPGVGAFDKAMEKLEPVRSELVEKLEEATPCLGICLGAQVLFESSEEGSARGLGFYDGPVLKLKANRVPHMGWNSVDCADAIMDGIDSPYFYFAHSYYGEPEEEVTIGSTDYFGRFPSVFLKGNTYGAQFHPEKSSDSGLRFLRNFVRFAEDAK